MNRIIVAQATDFVALCAAIQVKAAHTMLRIGCDIGLAEDPLAEDLAERIAATRGGLHGDGGLQVHAFVWQPSRVLSAEDRLRYAASFRKHGASLRTVLTTEAEVAEWSQALGPQSGVCIASSVTSGFAAVASSYRLTHRSFLQVDALRSGAACTQLSNEAQRALAANDVAAVRKFVITTLGRAASAHGEVLSELSRL